MKMHRHTLPLMIQRHHIAKHRTRRPSARCPSNRRAWQRPVRRRLRLLSSHLSHATSPPTTRLHNLQCSFSQILGIALSHVVQPYQERIVHDFEPLEEGHVRLELRLEETSFFWAEFEFSATADPVDVFERRAFFDAGAFLGVFAAV